MEANNSPSAQAGSNRYSNGSGMVKSVILVAVVAVLLIVVLAGAVMFMKKDRDGGMEAVKKDQYQAVFLTNGQVYFGKVEDMTKSTIKLTSIYYLQVQQSVQPAEQKKDDDKEAQISLAKLGEELHGPEDTMYIAKDQMLFWENLKDNGKVVQAIKNAGQK